VTSFVKMQVPHPESFPLNIVRVFETIVIDIRKQTGKGELQEPFPTHMTWDSPCSV